MAISDWPAGERTHERLLEQSANALFDAEVLTIFLGTGAKGKSTVDLARDLLNKFDGLRQMFCADEQEFFRSKVWAKPNMYNYKLV
jgi:DNA repair protein RadC